MTADPRIVRLAGEAEEKARSWSLYTGAMVWTDRATRQIAITIATPDPLTGAPDGIAVHGFFKLESLDELLRDLLAARADLVKLNGGKNA
jgi:hypothetical protein